MVTIVNSEFLIISVSGVFDSAAILLLARELNKIEAAGAYPKRLVFVDDTTSAAITSDDALFFKSYRKKPQRTVQTAFCAFNDFQYGMARMFQSVLESDEHRIEIFRDKISAAQWLNIDPALLENKQAGITANADPR